MMFRLFYAATLSCFLLDMQAQPLIPTFESIGVNEGLSQSSVYAIHQDRFGFMWFGTADGLNRYDGNEIKVFKVASQRLANESNFVRGRPCEDATGNIWFANEAGIHVFDQASGLLTTAREFRKQDYAGYGFETIQLKNDTLWLINDAFGIFAFSTKTKSLHKFTLPAFRYPLPQAPAKATADAAGNIWFSLSPTEGLYRFSTTTKTFTRFSDSQDYLKITFGQKKHFLIDAGGKVSVFDSLTHTTTLLPLAPNDGTTFRPTNVVEDRFGRLWSSSATDGLLCHDAQLKQSYFFRHDNASLKSIPLDLITTLFIDRNDNLWIGTDGGGVARLDLKPPKFNLFPPGAGNHPALKNYFIKCFYEDGQKRIWFGTLNSGLSIYQPATGKLKTYTHYNGKPLLAVAAIAGDVDGALWIGHSGGIVRFDENRGTFEEVVPSRLSKKTGPVYHLQRLRNGDMLAATSRGLVHFKKHTTIFTSKTYEGVPYLGLSATSLIETSEGDIWATSPIGGLMHLRLNDTLQLSEKFLEGVNLRSLHADASDPALLWLCSTKGLIRFNRYTQAYRVYNERDGMANSYVYGALEDDNHHLWLSTNGGLLCFNKKTGQFDQFTVNDGLQSNEFNTGAFYKSPSGTFYFGGIKGFNWFKDVKQGAARAGYKPGIAITSVLVNDKAVPKTNALASGQHLQLSHLQNNLLVHVAALDFTRPQANKIRYRLQGWDPGWTTTTTKVLRYTNLPPGVYRLSISAVNSDGVWSIEEQLTITIAAPFWQRGWFYGIVATLAISLIIIITRSVANRRLKRRLQVLEKQQAIEAERNRISKDMHDEIGSGLTHIALMSELMLTQPKSTEELQKDVTTISQSARRLVQSMSEIVWALNPQNDTLENLLAYLREQTAAYFEPFAIRYSVVFPHVLPPVKLSNEQRRNLFLVIKEALHNALKHAAANAITLRMELQQDTLHFFVEDNGRGFDEQRRRQAANGLRNMQRRMQDIGGLFYLQSDSCGTTIHVSLATVSANRMRTTFFTSGRKDQKPTFGNDDVYHNHRG